MQLGINGFTFADLSDPAGLARLHHAFLTQLAADDAALAQTFENYRQFVRAKQGPPLPPPKVSDVLVRVSTHLSAFVGTLFGVRDELAALRASLLKESALFTVRKEFVNKRAFKKGSTDRPKIEELPALDEQVEVLLRVGFAAKMPTGHDTNDVERALCEAISLLLEAEKAPTLAFEAVSTKLSASAEAVQHLGPALAATGSARAKALLSLLDRWTYARAKYTHTLHGWASFHQPTALVFDALVELKRPDATLAEAAEGPEETLRQRDGFSLTDTRGSARQVMGEIDSCLFCHEREKDSCSKGFKEKDPAATHTYKKNPLSIDLAGCPLEEHISEMHLTKAQGDSLAALALITIANPMVPGTGHRICNDCMKACIFQKQEPVNIPQIETSVLTDVLALPYGFEIYGLLTRWNPLNVERPHAIEANGKSVLVVGQGPAGYTLAHYLLNEGFSVAAVDGLKVEHFPPAWLDNKTPIRDWRTIAAPLNERIVEGFGGVSEYGITVRWDKSFLTLIHLTLARRAGYRLYGGVRFGGTLTIDDAWAFGFDHIAIAAGAGKPTVVPMKNNLIRGVRAASDFLMALQLSGAFKKDSLSTLVVELPALVIGGGLTGIDTATELMAYYPVQVEKALAHHERLVASQGEAAVVAALRDDERDTYWTFIEHGRAIRAERARAQAAGEKPDFVRLVRQWGGVSLCYRRSLTESPAYRLNHEEVAKALEEGIRFVERVSPVACVEDANGKLSGLTLERMAVIDGKLKGTGQHFTLPAKTLCMAAGTSPNVTYQREHPGTFELDDDDAFFKAYDAVPTGKGFQLSASPIHKDLGRDVGFFTSYQQGGRFITFFGDNHPTYAGNVVKAMASAKDGYRHIAKLFATAAPAADAETLRASLFARLDEALTATVAAVNRLTPTIVEVVVKAPLAAKKFEPGQFYRLQNFERTAPVVNGTRMTMEGLALTGAWVDKEKGLLSTIVLEMGASSRLCATLQVGQPVVLMGPTGAPTEIAANETVLLVGGGLGNAVLFSIGQALRAAGCRVLYFAGYKKAEDAYKFDELERAADQVIWATDGLPSLPPRRKGDVSFVGNIVEALAAYGRGELGPGISLGDVDRIVVIGSDRMMRAVKEARHGALKAYLKREHCAVGSINSPMQCMMKEICAQCLQRHVDPRTGKESFVFSCFNQDQPLDSVDFNHLGQRLRINSVLEKQADLVMQHLLPQVPHA
jgi:NADPH-dependent glutamate synthase beta subunit-like oxidoreductase/NAD(P)H-flavin reductase